MVYFEKLNIFCNFTEFQRVNAMKRKLIYISLCFLCILMLGSCTKEVGYEYQQGYNAGKQSFEYLESNMAAFLSFFDLSLRMNAYLEVPGELQPEVVSDYFPDYRVSRNENGDWIGLKGGDTVFRVAPDDLPLTTETAVWRLDGCCDVYDGAMKVTCTGSRSWTLELYSVVNGMWRSDAHLKIQYQGETLPTDFIHGDWIVSGSGQSVSDSYGEIEGQTILNFEVAESLMKISSSQYLFDKGVLFMVVEDIDDQRKEVIKAELKSLPESGRQLRVTYKGEVYAYFDR